MKAFKVNEWFDGFEVEHIATGQTHWLGDGVDTLFNDKGDVLSPGTPGFVEAWEDALNLYPLDTLEAYFPELAAFPDM